MTQLEKMYEGKINSPETFLRDRLVSGGSVIYLMDDSILPTLPNLLVIGKDQTAETVLVTEKRTDGGYDIQRAVQGTAKDWPQGTSCARNFTEYDYDKLIKNIEKLNNAKQEGLTAGSNITITNNKISAVDTTYTAGTNVTIAGTTISAKDTIYDDTALKTRITAVENREDKDTTYTAGANITIDSGNKISADVDLTGYAKLTGATFTGKISSPIVSTTRYFETPTLVGEGDDSKYFHRVVFGHKNFDKMEFHEYGGLFSFLENKQGGANDGRLLFQISTSGVDSKVPLKENGVRVYSPNNKPTATDLGITKSDVGLGSVNNVAITAAQVTKINELNYTKALTQAQYDALSTAEKNRTDVWYGIYK